MHGCPWCGQGRITFKNETEFPRVCRRCQRGLLDEWTYCPWCWGPQNAWADGKVRKNPRYDRQCRACKQPMTFGMRYCPFSLFIRSTKSSNR